MLFNSFEFLVFFILVIALYRLLRRNFRLQNVLLLFTSYIFYGWWDSRFLFLIVLSTITDYCAGLVIEKGVLKKSQRFYASLYVLISVFLFIILQWNNIQFDIRRLSFTFDPILKWTSFEQGVLIATLALLILGNLAYPFVVKVNIKTRRKIFLISSIIVNLSLLGFFKYYNFFIDSFVDFSTEVLNYTPDIRSLSIILPVGISFYTFQTMSYTIDVYRNELKASDNILEFGTYVAFFPQLVAGPIERGKQLLPQFRKPRSILTKDERLYSYWLITWGFFKKMVVADNMAMIVNNIFEPYDQGMTVLPENGFIIIIGILAFAFQIYGDFSGYSDIARGVAKLMGFDIMLNFNLPYFAISPSDFWRRWHISLSSWLRDYLYIPLGGNRIGKFNTYRNLFLTMLLGGLWHGAAWTFVIWGIYHGFILIAYRILNIDYKFRHRKRWQSLILMIIMFGLTCMGWLIFRAQNLTTIWVFIKAVFILLNDFHGCIPFLGDLAFFTWFLILFQFIQYYTKLLYPIKKFHWFIRLNIWIYIILSIIVLTPSVKIEFIYFAF